MKSRPRTQLPFAIFLPQPETKTSHRINWHGNSLKNIRREKLPLDIIRNQLIVYPPTGLRNAIDLRSPRVSDDQQFLSGVLAAVARSLYAMHHPRNCFVRLLRNVNQIP